MADPVFTDAFQICVVVPDLEQAMRTYYDDYGIGPWDIYDFNPETVSGMHESGEPVERSFRLALATMGQLQWELIQPLDDESTYARFLAEKGMGVHHVGVATPSFDGTIETLTARGHEVVFGGEYEGVNFAYLSTDRDLGLITEIFSAAPGEGQKPDAVYPPEQ